MPREPRLVKKSAALLTGKMIPHRFSRARDAPGTPIAPRIVWPYMFLFFSRRLGCAGSIIVSLGLSLLLLYLLGWL
jgi:hypothetical protein